MSSARIEDLVIHYDHYLPSHRAAVRRVIYIHGTGCNAKVFAPHLAAISQEHEVVAIDLPGHGRSGGSGFRSVADHAFFVGALIERLGWESCIVAGHSLGGGIALAVAIYFETLVSGLLLIDTGARLRVSPSVIKSARIAAGEGAVLDNDSRLGCAKSTPRSVVDQVNVANAGCNAEVIYKDWIAADSCDFMTRFAKIDVPALAICGAEDPLTPIKYHEHLRDNLPQCELVTVANAGHWPFAENPTEFNARVLEFLNRQ